MTDDQKTLQRRADLVQALILVAGLAAVTAGVMLQFTIGWGLIAAGAIALLLVLAPMVPGGRRG